MSQVWNCAQCIYLYQKNRNNSPTIHIASTMINGTLYCHGHAEHAYKRTFIDHVIPEAP